MDVAKEAKATRREVPYPGIATTVDGSSAAAWVETQIATGACAYPITPATNMGVLFEAEVANGKKNLWGEKLAFLEPESEHSAAAACEGYAAAGGRVTNFTCGQGLVLMKEVLYAIAGKRLPCVFHIAARAITSQSLNIHCGHDDIFGVADCGWGILFARNPGEVADLALIARRVAEECRTPFFVVQDGFLTSHTIESTRLPEPELMREFVGAPGDRLTAIFDPETGTQSGTVQNQDSYMKGRIAQRSFTDRIAPALQHAMDDYARLTGRRYRAVDSFGDGDNAIVALGTIAETARAVAAELGGVRIVHPTVVRPFPGDEMVRALHGTRRVAVIERTDDALAGGNPLARDVRAAFEDTHERPAVGSGSAGLGGREVSEGDLARVVRLMRLSPAMPRTFVLGVDHALNLGEVRVASMVPEGSFTLRGHSIGGYGSVTTNKLLATLIPELLGGDVRAWAEYGSEKKGLPTRYYLTASPVRSDVHTSPTAIDYLVVNDRNAMASASTLAGLARGAAALVQADADKPEIDASFARGVAEKGARLYACDMAAIARRLAPSSDLVVRMQGVVLLGAFLKTSPKVAAAGLSGEALFSAVRKVLDKQWGKRGAGVVETNLAAVRAGYEGVKEVVLA
ncbi:MAG: 2-oxoacid:acceptor oxidoreductase family protein [Deltaproteobacteria bacterium]|nr:2-oxoacid:acceptor oxidoreductase family protein [Deltaproteobacteria bacterium]